MLLAVLYFSELRLPFAPWNTPIFLSNYYVQHIFSRASLEVELSPSFPCRTQNINIRALKWKQDLGSHCFTRLLSTDLWPSLRSPWKVWASGLCSSLWEFCCCYDCCFSPPGLFWLNLGLQCKISHFQERFLTLFGDRVRGWDLTTVAVNSKNPSEIHVRK